MGNGARIAALAVGSYFISLPSGFVLELENYYYVPSITRNIISVSSLDSKGFSFQFKDNSCSFSLNEMFYGSAQQENGLYVLDTSKKIYSLRPKT